MTKGLIFLILGFLLNDLVAQVQSEHSHREHLHEVAVDGKKIALDASKFNKFSHALSRFFTGFNKIIPFRYDFGFSAGFLLFNVWTG